MSPQWVAGRLQLDGRPPLPQLRRLPQIYAESGANTRQWKQISLYGARHQDARLHFLGSLTQHQACQDRNEPCPGIRNTPEDGWRQLHDELNTDQRTAQRLRRATDIRWQITTSGPADLPPPATAEVDALLHRPIP